MSTSQTLDRGLRALASIALAPEPPTIAALARTLDVHRSIAYRIVRTLEAHRLVERDATGRCRPGLQLAALARAVRPALQAAAIEELALTANELGFTAFLVVADGEDAVTVESVEPAGSQVHITYRPGVRHRLDRGAPGLAILAAGPSLPGERPEVATSRQRGWAHSESEVVPGLGSVAAPVPGAAAAVAVIFPAASGVDLDHLARRIGSAADAIARRLVPHAILQGAP